MGIFDSLGSLWDWLTTQSPGGSVGGTPYLGVGSPTASTQTPSLGGAAPAGGGGLFGGGGLLGGQQPLLASYFQPQGGGLLGFGNTPLGGMIRGGLEGLGSAQGVGGLTGVGVAAMGAGQAEQQRRQNQMATLAAGQQYQQGQAQMASTNMQIAEALRNYNIMNKVYNPGAPDLTYNDLMNDPQKLSQVMAASGSATLASITGGPTGTATQPPIGGTTAPALQGGTITIPGTTRTLPSGSTATTQPQQIAIPSGTLDQAKQAIAQIEGTTPDPASGAIGGLTPGTFDLYNKKYFGGQLNFANEADRAKVSDQLYADLAQVSTDPNTGQIDPARLAVGYFSGQGNIAPFGSPTPYRSLGAPDAHGTTIPSYLRQFATNLQNLQGAPGTGQGQAAMPSAPAADQLTAAFAQSHYGYTPAQWRQIGVATGNKAMQDEADKWDPALITGTAAATAAGTPYPGRPGGQMQTSTGQPIGRGTPQLTNVQDPTTKDMVPANVYPNGDIQYLGGPNAGKIVSAGGGGGAISAPSPFSQAQQTHWADQLSDWGKGQRQSLVAENQMQVLASALTQTQGGMWATNKAEIADKLKAVGLEGLAKTLFPNNDSAAVQVALRNQFAAAIGQIMPSVSTPAQQQLAQAQQSLVGPNTDPGASRTIMGQVIGTLRWDRDMYKAASQTLGKTPGDPDAFSIQWAQDHPIDDYVKKATDALPMPKGSSPVDTAVQTAQQNPAYKSLTNIRHFPDGHIAGQDANGNWVDPNLKQKWDGLTGKWVAM